MKKSISNKDANNQNWLFGVPKKMATLWWRIVFWRDAIARHNVPEHIRLRGMFCPVCRKVQPFSDRCAFCQCEFPCFVIITTTTNSRNKRQASRSTSLGKGLNAPLHALFKRVSKVSLRNRAIAAILMFLLLTSLVVGIVRYKGYVRSQYAHNYVQALYIIKSGMNMGEMVCDGTFNAWRGIESSSTPEVSHVGPEARDDLQFVHAEINKIMGGLDPPSAEYTQADRILRNIYSLYEKTNSMVLNSPDAVSMHTTEIVAAKAEFSREINSLKANLPAPLADELKKASQKYDLRFIIDGK
ncbi:MAG: hypothetical protein HIU83_17385 [Proteobacteria bacterium]|nr:hypothetical protein [Pseudomonadota bacterium]